MIDVETEIQALWNGQGMELRPEGFARVGHSSGEGRVAARVASLHPPTPAMLLFYIPCVARTEHFSNIEPFEREPVRGPSD